MMSSTLIFDLDGTLVDSCATCVDILTDMLVERGSLHVIDHAYARPWMSYGGIKMVSALLGEHCGDPAVELADFRSRYAVHNTHPEALFPYVAEGLLRLKAAGHQLAICSNKPQNLCEKVLKDTGLIGLFSAVVGSRPGLAPKPAPDILLEVLQKLKVDRRQCVFIGDSELDHAVADAVGMPFHFMSYGYADEHYQPHPYNHHDDFMALTDRLLVMPHHA
jgi:phosphoglycolate phosphatase